MTSRNSERLAEILLDTITIMAALVQVASCSSALYHLTIGRPFGALAAIGVAWVARRVA